MRKRLTKNFHEDEFYCKCQACQDASNGIGDSTRVYVKLDFGFVHMLQKARNIAGIPFVFNSAYRCHAHNKAVGSRADSAHPKGSAVDIKNSGYKERFIIVAALIEAGFTRIKIYQNHIHADIDPSKPSPYLEVD